MNAVKEKTKKLLDNWFKLSERNTNARKEIAAGTNIFIAISYIAIVNPQILSDSGMPYNAAYLATVFSTIVSCGIMAFYCNIPYAAAPRMGLNAFFSYTICLQLQYTWQEALCMVFISSALSLFAPAVNIHRDIPANLKYSINGGIGIFIAYTGIKNSGLIKFTGTTEGFSSGVATLPSLVNFGDANVKLSLLGIVITIAITLYAWKNKKNNYSLIIGIIITTIIGYIWGTVKIPEHFTLFSLSDFYEYQTVCFSAITKGFLPLMATVQKTFVSIMLILTLTLTSVFDSIGTFAGLDKRIKRYDDRKYEEAPVETLSLKTQKALKGDSFSGMAGALLGASSTGAFIESELAVTSGAKTGLTPLITGLLFTLFLIGSNIAALAPVEATAPALIIVGIYLLTDIDKIEWTDISEAIPAFFTLVFISLCYNISYGIAIGFIVYCIVQTILGNLYKIKRTILVVSILFFIIFIFIAKYNL